MKIWLASKYAAFPTFGGGTRQFYLSRGLVREGNEVTLIASRSSYATSVPSFEGNSLEGSEEGVHTVVLNGRRIKKGFSIRRVWSWLEFEFRFLAWWLRRSNGPDVVIVSSLSILTFLSGIAIKCRYQCKLVVEVRDIYPLTLTEVGGISNYNPLVVLLRWVERLGYTHADLIVSSLERFDCYIREDFPGLARKVLWIPMGVDSDVVGREGAQTLKRSGRKFVVGYAGSFSKSQATAVIFEAARLLKDDQRIEFHLAGSGPEKAAGMASLGKPLNVRDCGVLSKKDLPQFLARCDVLLNPWLDLPIYRYGVSPNKLMDYMLAAKPVIMSFGGRSAIMELSGCGSIIEPGDAEALVREILRYAEMTPDELGILGQRGRSYVVNELSWTRHAKKLATALSELQ